MKKLLIFIIITATVCSTTVLCGADVSVKGYHRKNGTYVQPYHRSAPDGNPYNNYSTKGVPNSSGTYSNAGGDVFVQGYYRNRIPNYPSKRVTKSPLYDVNWPVQKQADVGNSKYLKQQGHNFDPNWPNTSIVDTNVRELSGRKATPTIAKIPETPSLGQVNGILWSEDRPFTIIERKIMREGDTINGVKVIKIHKDKIEFEKNGNRWTQGVGAILPQN